MTDVGCAIVMHTVYACGIPADRAAFINHQGPQPVDDTTPIFRNISISHLTARNVAGPILALFHGLPEMPIRNIVLEDVVLEASPIASPTFTMPALGAVSFDKGGDIAATYVENLRLRNVALTPRSFPPRYVAQETVNSLYSAPRPATKHARSGKRPG